MKTYKLTYHPLNSPIPLATRVVRAKDEQDARRIAYEFIEDEQWLNTNITRCEQLENWRDQLNVEHN